MTVDRAGGIHQENKPHEHRDQSRGWNESHRNKSNLSVAREPIYNVKITT